MPIPTVKFEPSSDYGKALERAAAMWGIESEYWDIWGKRHATSLATSRAILESLGVNCATREGVDAAVEERLGREWSRPTPATLVVGENLQPRVFPLTVPAGLRGAFSLIATIIMFCGGVKKAGD